MNVELLLIRHGDAEQTKPENFNTNLQCPDPDLTDTGRAHARRLGERLGQAPLQRIYSSDLRRAAQTSEILAEATGAPVEIRAELREINMGRLFVTSWEQIEREMPDFAAQWHRHESDLAYPGGECGADVVQRAMPLVEEIVQNSRIEGPAASSRRVAIVTHGGTIRCLLSAFLGLALEKRLLLGAPLENCGLSVVRWDGQRQKFLVHSVNDAAHLG